MRNSSPTYRLRRLRMGDSLRSMLKETEAGRMEMSGLAADFYNDGRLDTQRESAERMLRVGMEPALIAHLLAMPLEGVESIKAELDRTV